MEVFMTAVKSPPNKIKQKKCPKNKMSITSAKLPSSTTSINLSKAQFLDGRPIVIYKGPDQLLWTTRDEIVKIVDNKQNASRILKKAQKQMNALFENVSSWVEQHKKQIAGFGGCWKYNEDNNNSKLPIITAYFAIVQVKSDEIDEPLWIDLADFDVQIANNPEFSNVRMNISAVPNIEQETLLKYIKRHLHNF
jgi:hypothetical protein